METVGDIKYQREPLIGEGEFATVHHGEYQNKQVAVKKLLIKSGEEVTCSEIEAISKLDHLNVLKLVHYEHSSDFWFLVLDLCTCTLTRYREQLKQPEGKDKEIDALMQMARGVEHIHLQGLIHRDIKPDNILVQIGENGAIIFKISDFGFTKKINENGSFSISVTKGTLNYMAAELQNASTQRGTTASDVFSLGCVFYFFLTKGGHPFRHGSNIINNILNGTPNLDELKKKKQWAVKLVESMIHHEVVKRLRNGKEVAENVQKISKLPNFKWATYNCYYESKRDCVYSCAFDSTGTKLACALKGGRVVLFDQSWKPRFSSTSEITTYKVYVVKWGVNGSQSKLAAGCADGTVFMWDTDTNQIQILKTGRHNKSAIWCLNWSPQSDKLATGSVEGKVRILDTNQNTDRELYSYTHPNDVKQVIWLESQKLVSLSTDGDVRICNLKTSEPTLIEFCSHKFGPICRHPVDASKLVTCFENGIVKDWDWTTFEFQTITASGPFECLCIDCSETLIACGGRKSLNVWSSLLNQQEMEYQLDEHSLIIGVSFSPNNRYLAAFEQYGQNECKVNVWSTEDWTKIENRISSKEGFYNCLAWDPSSCKLAIANKSWQVYTLEFNADVRSHSSS